MATPQSQAMNADSLQAFDNAVASGKYGYVDGILITRNGKLIYQKKYTHDYDSIYGDSARTRSGLNPHDPGGNIIITIPGGILITAAETCTVCNLLPKQLLQSSLVWLQPAKSFLICQQRYSVFLILPR